MKKSILALAVLAFITISACHYGQDEAQKTLETNETYKGDKKDYSTNRGNDGVLKSADEQKAAETAPAEAAPADTTKK